MTQSPTVERLLGDRAWCNHRSASSDPVRDLVYAAASIAPASEIRIPRAVWARFMLHPSVTAAYNGVSLVPTEQTSRCSNCGTYKGVFRPPLDTSTVDVLLNAGPDGPILPGSVVLTNDPLPTVTLSGAGGTYELQAVCHLYQ